MARECFEFELLDDVGKHLRMLHPLYGVEIRCTSGTAVARTIPTMVLGAEEGELVYADRFALRVRAWMTRDGVDEPLGVFRITSALWVRADAGDKLSISLHDLGSLLTGTLDEAFGVTAGDVFVDALAELLATVGITASNVVASGAFAGNHLGWAAGTQLAEIAASLAKKAGLGPPWVDRHGAGFVTFLPVVGVDKPRARFQPGKGGRIVAGSFQETADTWAVPTSWRVKSRGQGANISGVYNLPAEHPLSAARRHPYRFQRVIDVPGLASSEEAAARAKDEAQRDARVHRTIQFSAPIDVTLEPNDVISVGREDWLLESWSIPCVPGGRSQVTAREGLAA